MPMTVGIKYCGGCNPRYDRINYVNSITSAFPMHRFLPAKTHETYDALLVICGCHVQCPDISDIHGDKGTLMITEDLYLDAISEFFDSCFDTIAE